MNEVILFHTDQISFCVSLPPRIETVSNRPRNFGSFLPDRYRGSLPTDHQLTGLKRDLGIVSVLTLYSLEDPHESVLLEPLKILTAKEGVKHDTVNIDIVDSFFTAAILLLSAPKPSYLHCTTGANRTSIVALIASLFEEKANGRAANETKVIELLSEAISYGFDFDKLDRKKDMEDILALSTARNLII